MDIISRFIATSTVLLHVLVFLRGQNDLVKAQDTPYIIFGNRVAIHQMGLDGSNRVSLHSPTSRPIDIRGLDFDFNRDMMYWSDVANEVIMQSRLDGSDVRTLVSTGLIEPENIAWDWVNQKLYWTDKDNDTIKVYDPVRDIQKTLVNTGAGSQPRAIVVDPSTRYLYWTDWSDGNPRIVKTSMDGKNSTILANRTWVTWPNALAIDYTNQVLYWGDAQRDLIGRVSTDGSDIGIIANLTAILQKSNHPWAMSYYNGHIYWSDWLNGRAVQKMSVGAGSDRNIDTIVMGIGGNNDHPTGIHVVDASRQSSQTNPCGDNNGGCSHLCLLSPTDSSGFTCACPEDIQLNQNGRHCGDLPATTTSAAASEPVTTPIQSIGPCNTSSPCQNGATCVNLGMGTAQYFCVCIGGFSGRDCTITPVLPPNSGPSNGDNNSNTVITAVVLVLGAILVVIVLAVVMIIVLYVFYKLKNGKAKERSQSFSALSTTSSRDSPTHIVVFRNGRNQSEHDYASIKSRDSPAPKGGFVIYNLPNGNGNHYVYPQPTESIPLPSFQRGVASNGTLNGYLASSMEKSDSSVKDSDTEPFYSNIKSKTNTL